MPSYEEPILGGIHICRPAPIYIKRGGEIGFTLLSDLHIGAPQVDYKLIRKEITEAKANNDRVLINGDVFDGILPKDHKRYTPDAIHPRLQGRVDIVNAIVDWGVEELADVAHLIDMIGVGNHETALTKYHAVDPVLLLVYELQKLAKEKSPEHVIHYGGFTGFVDYRLRTPAAGGKITTRGKERDYSSGARRWVIYYHHGSGGAAPVTKGMIDFNRKDTFVDADCIWMGHKHNRWAGHVQKLTCPMGGDDVVVKDVRHVMTGAYFKTYNGQSQESIRKHGRRSNYAADAGYAPQGAGGARVLLKMDSGSDNPPEVRVTQ